MTRRERIAVVGGGYMGGGIAQALALAGHEVRVADADSRSARASVERIRRELRLAGRAGIVDRTRVRGAIRRIVPASSLEQAVHDVGLVLEAVPEALDVKRRVLRRIDDAAPTVLVGTNTSALPLGELAVALDDPGRLLAVHWFNPAMLVPLVEIAGGDDAAAERVGDLLRRAGKLPVRVPDVPGFLGNRMQFALYREAALIVEEGLADAATVDAVVTASFGTRLPFLGPLLVGDIAGLDVYLAAFRSLEGRYGARFAPPASLVARVDAGDLGIKSGGGLRGIAPERRDELARYRDRMMSAVAGLRRRLPPPV